MDLKSIKGIGDKTAQLLNHLGVYRAEELIELYPRDYASYEEPVSVAEAAAGTELKGVFLGITGSARMNKVRNLSIFSIEARDESGQAVTLTWFNMPFLRNVVRRGNKYVFYGRVMKKGMSYVMEQPKMYSYGEYKALLGMLWPVYPLTKGLSNKIISKAVAGAFQVLPELKEFMNKELLEKADVCGYSEALYKIHFPKDMNELAMARKRLVFQEFLLFILSMGRFKSSGELIKNNFYVNESPVTREFIQRLPYELTKGQQAAYKEICNDMQGERVMNRLVQGDVGCGKTIVALLALMNVVYEGYQGAMMVPTEVLAKQQYESACKLFKENGININVCLLIGSMTAKEKRLAYEQMESGEAGIIIGTHALIQEKAVYNNLGLVVTDEQHRFGVNQREALFHKGLAPHVLVMSATPIPRTLAIILYGDLDISLIKELPANRLPIKNCVVDHDYRTKAYDFIVKEVSAGHQAYIICPMVEESETTEAENVVEYCAKLKTVLPDNIECQYLHGKMNGEEKQRIMEAFARNEIHVLVSTTVIEVGVNVPNATVMLVEDANRFGLAQLHQLRGRVGRGDAQSYCIFMAPKLDEKTRARLDILNKSNDGFKIAEEDLKLRGPGQMFGVRQSGEFSFRLGDIYADATLLQKASVIAKEILARDPQLTSQENQGLANEIARLTADIKLC